GAFFIFLTGAPLVAREIFGVSSATLGLYVGSITAGFMTGSFLSGRLAKRVAPTTLILAGRLSACLGPSLGLLAAAFGLLSPLTCFGATIFVGLGNGLTTPNGNAKAMSVDPERIGAAAGFAGAMNVGIGSVLTLIAGFVVAGPNAASLLLTLMLVSSAIGLAAILWAIRLERAG
ncbi:MAG: MFS transporter, partial [Pseudomonadota bacterium]